MLLLLLSVKIPETLQQQQKKRKENSLFDSMKFILIVFCF